MSVMKERGRRNAGVLGRLSDQGLAMRTALSSYLLEVHQLLGDQRRDRGIWPGSALERDLQALAESRWLHAERRVRRGPYGGVYYSGLRPETDLFVYDGPEFLQIEAKDLTGSMSRAIPTEFWARALDLHLGRARDTLPEARKDHYPVLVFSTSVTDELRAACIRWGISLLEPRRIPFAILGFLEDGIGDCLQQAGCSAEDLRWACLPYNDRFPRNNGGVLFPFGPIRSKPAVAALLRLQRIATVNGVARVSMSGSLAAYASGSAA